MIAVGGSAGAVLVPALRARGAAVVRGRSGRGIRTTHPIDEAAAAACDRPME